VMISSATGACARDRESGSGALSAAIGVASTQATARVELPERANEPTRVVDVASGQALRFTLVGALDGAGSLDSSGDAPITRFRGAGPEGSDLSLRASDAGVEDFIVFHRAPTREEIRYRVEIEGAAGLRLVGNTLELLDAGGVPVLRVAPPYVVGADGATHDARLSVVDCATDTDPRPPFGRAPIDPGSSTCTVAVSWRDVSYPALVDPVWASTRDTMAVARTSHTLTLLNPTDPKSLALVAGGVSVNGGAALASAEIYDPLSRRFTATGSMSTARSLHTATLLTTLVTPPNLVPAQPVLVAGGADSASSPLASLEVYDPASGLFIVDANTMAAAPRFGHTATLFADTKVLLAGGTIPPLNQPTNTAYVYTFNGFKPGSPPTGTNSTLTQLASTMSSSRTNHAATALPSGDVLLCGGYALAGGTLQGLASAELFHPMTQSFGAITPAGGGSATMSSPRGDHTATPLANGAVLIAGGQTKTVGGTFLAMVDLFFDGSQGMVVGFAPQPVPILMATARARHTATALPTGDVLVAGGFGVGGAALSSAERYASGSMTFAAVNAAAPMVARGGHAALLVNAGDAIDAGKSVLVTGGSASLAAGSAATKSAQILLEVDGDACSVDGECLSGFCVDGVCCDTACDGQCDACSVAAGSSGPDGTCSPLVAGTAIGVDCNAGVEVTAACDATGNVAIQVILCEPYTCSTSGTCALACDATTPCASGSTCDVAGKCVPSLLPDGAVCAVADACASGFCADEVCCDAACDGACQDCDLSGAHGQCGTAVGRLLSATCADASDPSAPSTLSIQTCAADGSSPTDTSECGRYRCDGSACKTTCTVATQTSDCLSGSICFEGACVPPVTTPPPDEGCSCNVARDSDAPSPVGFVLAALGFVALHRRRRPRALRAQRPLGEARATAHRSSVKSLGTITSRAVNESVAPSTRSAPNAQVGSDQC
jgi:MYXO-CTERM domain-containing protein